MINFFLKNAVKKAVVKLATDKNFRAKAKTIVNNTKELKNEGKLMRSLGRGIGRLRSKIKKDL